MRVVRILIFHMTTATTKIARTFESRVSADSDSFKREPDAFDRGFLPVLCAE